MTVRVAGLIKSLFQVLLNGSFSFIYVDGWVYTNDAWLGARPAPYTAGGGSVTRRRKWTRRVWYDKERAEREG